MLRATFLPAPPPAHAAPNPPSLQFGKRILIQRRCQVCSGTGLVPVADGVRVVKCRACGGFFPWQSWTRFLSSAPGNGGPLRQPTLPRQTGVLYRVPTPAEAATAAEGLRRVAGKVGEGGGEVGVAEEVVEPDSTS